MKTNFVGTLAALLGLCLALSLSVLFSYVLLAPFFG